MTHYPNTYYDIIIIINAVLIYSLCKHAILKTIYSYMIYVILYACGAAALATLASIYSNDIDA